jgi:hypothetical protein
MAAAQYCALRPEQVLAALDAFLLKRSDGIGNLVVRKMSAASAR